MARRFYLVPSDQYQHMLTTASSVSKAEEPLLTHTENKMKSLLKGRKRKGKKINMSVRKALYDQELLRYLKQRKEIKDRPVKVEMVRNGKRKMLIEPKGGENNDKVSTVLSDEKESEFYENTPQFSKTFPIATPIRQKE